MWRNILLQAAEFLGYYDLGGNLITYLNSWINKSWTLAYQWISSPYLFDDFSKYIRFFMFTVFSQSLFASVQTASGTLHY